MEKEGFFKNHADTMAIIAINIAIAAIIINITLSNMASISAANLRSDTLYKELIEVRKEANELALKSNRHDWQIQKNSEGIVNLTLKVNAKL